MGKVAFISQFKINNVYGRCFFNVIFFTNNEMDPLASPAPQPTQMPGAPKKGASTRSYPVAYDNNVKRQLFR